MKSALTRMMMFPSNSAPAVDERSLKVPLILAKQSGATIEKIDDEAVKQYGCSVAVEKYGYRVCQAEMEAMRLVQEHTDIPSPRLFDTCFFNGSGHIIMSFIPGNPLDKVWETMDDRSKERLCHELWIIIGKLRSIPRSPHMEGLFACLADGSDTSDPLLKDLSNPARPISNDDELRSRIYELYYHWGGRKYEKVLPDMLPRSSNSVFTHADIAPRNVLVDDNYQITGLVDWERSGWFPDYWELANLTAAACRCGDWQDWMLRTAPKDRKCDLQGIVAARAVLF